MHVYVSALPGAAFQVLGCGVTKQQSCWTVSVQSTKQPLQLVCVHACVRCWVTVVVVVCVVYAVCVWCVCGVYGLLLYTMT